MKIRKTVGVLCILLMITAVDVQAYQTIGKRWAKTSINYYYTNSVFASGASAWSGLDAKFIYSPTYYDVNCYTVSDLKAAWDGASQIGQNSTHIVSVTITVNTAASQTWNNSNAVKSVVAHEFGHALGLNENGSSRTIMNDHTWGANSRYGTYGLTQPQADDRAGVNAIY